MVAVVKAAYDDILLEMQRTPKASHHRYELSLFADGAATKVEAIKIIHLDFRSDFEQNYADLITVQAVVYQKDFIKTIFPNRNVLNVELKRIPIGERSEAIDTARQTVVRTYRAVLLDHREDQLQGGPATDDKLGMREIVLQLLDPLIEQLRLQTFGNNFYQEPVDAIIKWILLWHSKQIKVSDEHSVKGVQMWPPNQSEVLDNTIIPHGVALFDCPGWIQEKAGGVYNYGIGFYLHSPWTPYGKGVKKGRIWHVYPLYDPTRYEKSEYRLDVVVIPPNQLSGAERSWYLKDSTFYVATSGQVTHVDTKDHQYVNLGNAVRFVKASDAFEKWVDVKSNVATADSSKTTAQYYTDKRDNGKQAAPFGERRFTDNVCKENTELTKRAIQYFKLTWTNSASEYLYPGMPARIVYHTAQGKRELYGTLLAIEENVAQDVPGVTSQRMRANCGLTFAILPRQL